MTTQTTLTESTAQSSVGDWTDDAADTDGWPPYEDYGPTADRPAPEWLYDGQEWDRRRAIAAGVDWDGWRDQAFNGRDWHRDDGTRPERLARWRDAARRADRTQSTTVEANE